MATQQYGIKYRVGFETDLASLLKTVNEAISALLKISVGGKLGLSKEMQQTTEQARLMSDILQRAVNVDTGKLDLTRFRKDLEKSGIDLQEFLQRMMALGPQGEDAFLQIANAVTLAELPVRRVSLWMDKLWATMKNTIRWQFTSRAWMTLLSSIRTAYSYSQDLNESLNNIRIVTGHNADEMARFAENANKAAAKLNTTTTEYTDASRIYFQQGLDDAEVERRTAVTIKLANAAGISAEQASSQLTAIWNNFSDGSDNLERYADVLVKLGATTASSSEEISKGMQKFAAVADTVGLSYEYAASALATIVAKTRNSAEEVGTSLRTIFARFESLKLGETLEDGVGLNKYTAALASVGVNVLDSNGQLRQMDDILDDIFKKWGELNQAQLNALATTVAGVRQYANFIALFKNADTFYLNVGTAQGAEGALQAQANIYAESWEAAKDLVKNAALDIYDSLINADFFIDFDKKIASFLHGIASVVDGFGGLKGVLPFITTAFSQIFNTKVAQLMRDMATSLGISTRYEQEKALALLLQAYAASSNLINASLVLNKDDLTVQERLTMEKLLLEVKLSISVASEKWNAEQKNAALVIIHDLEALLLAWKDQTEAIEQATTQFNEYRDLVNNARKMVQEPSAIFSNAKTALTDYTALADVLNLPLLDKSATTQEYLNALNEIDTKKAQEELNKLTLSVKMLEAAMKEYASIPTERAQAEKVLQEEIDGWGKKSKAIREATELYNDYKNQALQRGESFISHADLDLINAKLKDTGYTIKNVSFNHIENEFDKMKQASLLEAEYLDKLIDELNTLDNTARDTTGLEQFELRIKELTGLESPHFENWALAQKYFIELKNKVEIAKLALAEADKELQKDKLTYVDLLNKMKELTPTAKNLTETILQLGERRGGLSKIVADLNRLLGSSKLTEGQVKLLNQVLASLGVDAHFTTDNTVSEAITLMGEQSEIVEAQINELKTAIAAVPESILPKKQEILETFDAFINSSARLKSEMLGASLRLKEFGDAAGAVPDKLKAIAVAKKDWAAVTTLAISGLTAGVTVVQTFTSSLKILGDSTADGTAKMGAMRSMIYAVIPMITSLGNAIKDILTKVNATGGWITIIAMGLSLIISLLSTIETSLLKWEKASQAALDASEKYKKNLDDIKNTNDEIASLHQQLEELQNIEVPSVTTIADISRLETQIQLLETRNALLKNTTDILKTNKVAEAKLMFSTTKPDWAKGSTFDWYSEMNNGNFPDLGSFSVLSQQETYNKLLPWLDPAVVELLAEVTKRGYWNSWDELKPMLVNAYSNYAMATPDGLEMTFLDFIGLLPEVELYKRIVAPSLQIAEEEAFALFFADNLEDILATTTTYQEALMALGPGKYDEEMFQNYRALMRGAFKDRFYKYYVASSVTSDILKTIFNDEQLSAKLQDQLILTGLTKEDIQEYINGLESKITGVTEDRLLKTLSSYDAKELLHFFALVNNGVTSFGELMVRMSEDGASATAVPFKATVQGINDLIAALKAGKELTEDQQNLFDWLAKKIPVLSQLRKDSKVVLDILGSYAEVLEAKDIQDAANRMLKTIKPISTQEWLPVGTDKTTGNPVYLVVQKVRFDTTDFDEFLNASYEVEVAIKADFDSDITSLFNQTSSLSSLEGLYDKNLSFEEAFKLLDLYPDILTNMEMVSDTEIRLNSDILKSTIENERSKVQAYSQTLIDKYKLRREDLVLERKNYLALLDAVTQSNADVMTLNKAKSNFENAEALRVKNYTDNMKEIELQKSIEVTTDELANEGKAATESVKMTAKAAKQRSAIRDAEYRANMARIHAELAAVAGDDLMAEHWEKRAEAAEQSINKLSNLNFTPDLSFDENAITADGETIGNTIGKGIQDGVETSWETLWQDFTSDIDNETLRDLLSSLLSGKIADIDEEIKSISGTIEALEAFSDKLIGNFDFTKNLDKSGKSAASLLQALKDVIDRYHEINLAIAYQEKILNRVDKAINRAYGPDKLKLLAQKDKELQKSVELERLKLLAAEGYALLDKATLLGMDFKHYTFYDEMALAFTNIPLAFEFDEETGMISNYTAILTSLSKAYDDLVSKGDASLKKEGDALKEFIDIFKENSKSYEDSLIKVMELADKVAEKEYASADTRLTIIDTQLLLKLDSLSVKDAVNELNKALIQSNGDILDYGIDLLSAREKDFDGLVNKTSARLDKLSALRDELSSNDTGADRNKIVSEISSMLLTLVQDAQSALEFIAEWEKEYSEAVNAAMERFNWYISRLSHNSSVASTIKELLTLQGVTNKTADGFGKLQKVLQTLLDAAIAQGKLQKDAYDYWTAQVAIANENWNSVKDNVNDINYDRYKNDLQAVMAQQEAAQDAMLASAKESMELARTMYEELLERAKIEFEQIMTDGSSISELQKQFDHFIDENERYFDEVNTAFQIADWQAKLQADIDNTTNAALRQLLQLLQEEIETRAEGGKLNQYDLDILNAKYNQMQALMALEDARNNKNTLRLVRDSLGNWNYQYTNNADDVAALEQKLAQANNEYYNIAKKQTQDVTSLIISLWQECEDEVNEIFKDSTLTEEERNAKVAERRAYYAQKAADLEREKAQAIADMTAAASAAGMEFSNSYIARLSEMTAKNVDFEANLDDLLNKCSGYYNNFSAVVAGVTEDTGTDISSLDGYTNDLAESTRNFGDDAEEAWGKAKTALEEYAEVLNSLVPTMEEASLMALNLKTVGDAAAKTVEKTSGLGYHDEIVYDQLGAYAKSAGASTDVLRLIYSERQMKISANPELSKYSMSWEEFLEHINGLTKYQVGNISDATLAKFKDWLNLMGIQSLATGGYTGDFSDGRLALLHEKELVLNASDTRNILTAVTLTRQMAAMLEAAIDGSANAGLALMRSRFGERVEIPTLPGDQLEQMIHIDQIEFPNVTTASEIQEAFRNLADNASQWARRRKS